MTGNFVRTGVGTKIIGGDAQQNMLNIRYTHANHGTVWFMPWFVGSSTEAFEEELLERGKKINERAAIELFDPVSGGCAYNTALKMCYVPPDAKGPHYRLLSTLGSEALLLTCIRSGFLANIARNKFAADSAFELLNHLRREHNGRIYVVGYNNDEYLNKDRPLMAFMHDMGILGAKARTDYGLSDAIITARQHLISEHKIPYRTIYMDDIYHANKTCESGVQVAIGAHAAPLITKSLCRCPKCFEPWKLNH